MRRRCGTALGVAVLALLVGCTTPAVPRRDPRPAEPARTSWQLGHRVPASSGLRVLARSASGYSDATQLALDAGGQDTCSVSWYPAGTYGPENKVGEQVPVEVDGRPGVRAGAGAEGGYLMWQRPDASWAEVSCYPDESPATHRRVAEAVVWEPTSMALPFDLERLPAGYGPESVEVDVVTGATTVRLGPGPLAADGGLVLSFDGSSAPTGGRPVTVGGRAATQGEDARFPWVCLLEQGHRVCVAVDSSDTGPYPDRSGEVPALLAVAEALRFPADLDDRSSWTTAEDVFG
ncbi:hypothetical protein ACFFOM_14020 [Microlunatus capsulatus]|uniref:Lipoprotein n=1 Tax=Microlunatus capsulatus TaxID=99117 RepID=A0ABS4Z7V4_9ACTN|nr:hypothetical protein [Microlunatus capsulatus]MBP2417136.1 hypothetical protein [Microlunatus capsulatus]